jgi:hypothetical protein
VWLIEWFFFQVGIQPLFHPFLMEYQEPRKIKKVLRNRDRTSIFITTKFHENEQQVVTQVATIMCTHVQQKRQMEILKVECNMLRNMVINKKGRPTRDLESSSIHEFKLWNIE